MLSLRVSLETTVDVPHAAAAEVHKVGPVNIFMHSLFNQVDVLFNQVDVLFNQKPVSPPTNAYSYRAYLETLLNYGPAAKNSHLTSVLWYNESAGKMDDGKDANIGLVQRRKLLSRKIVNKWCSKIVNKFQSRKIVNKWCRDESAFSKISR